MSRPLAHATTRAGTIADRSPLSRGRIIEIDGIRGLLSLVVLFGHIDASVVPWSSGAMEFFFVISGYLITDICLRHSQDSNFYRVYIVRRCLRIWPLYFVVLLTCSIWTYALSQIGASNELAIRPLVMCLTFTQNLELIATIFKPTHGYVGYPHAFGHSWSVAIEEQFYILAAAFIPFSITTRGLIKDATLYVLFGILAASVSFRVLGMNHSLLIARADGFVLGALLAILLGGPNPLRANSPIRALLARVAKDRHIERAVLWGLFFSAWYIFASYHQVGDESSWGNGVSAATLANATAVLGCSILAFGVIGYIIKHADSVETRGLRSSWLVHLGRISYSTYLWHVPLFTAAATLLPRYLGVAPGFALLATLPLALCVSHISFIFIEAPFLRVGSKMTYVADAPWRTASLADN